MLLLSEMYVYFYDFLTLIRLYTHRFLIKYAFYLIFLSFWMYKFGKVMTDESNTHAACKTEEKI